MTGHFTSYETRTNHELATRSKTRSCAVEHPVLHRYVMTKTLTLRDANQSFARCIRAVEVGEEFIITRNGTPVARLSPVSHRRVLTPEQQAAWERTQERMEEGWDIGAGPLDRDALHGR